MKCFSLSGWWQTLCGLDAANQGFGWSSVPTKVGCKNCLEKIRKGEHKLWNQTHILVRDRVRTPSTSTKSLKT